MTDRLTLVQTLFAAYRARNQVRVSIAWPPTWMAYPLVAIRCRDEARSGRRHRVPLYDLQATKFHFQGSAIVF